jgi:hypothetical protein
LLDYVHFPFEVIECHLVAGYEGWRLIALALIAMVVTRQPVLVTIDIEIARQTVIGKDFVACDIVIKERFR